MLVIFGKDDRLPDLVSVIDLEAVFHKDAQHLANGVRIEEPFIQRA